ncbi:rRNA processing protein [Grosmannia clavigera kw1407]|uniref:rRNA processing protein n=2 Tax=Leptographium clavigerum TaxID=226899 RepID=F0XRG2_GROCL|nr:rRNA processing protein [Grosmannia clavigera kw1407]EFW99738.1 rRNA processing protein [Grosmannia clavigera kw1407]
MQPSFVKNVQTVKASAGGDGLIGGGYCVVITQLSYSDTTTTMGRSALRAALAAEKGVDFKKLREKKRYKQGVKEKTKKGGAGSVSKKDATDEWEDEEEEAEESDAGDEDEDRLGADFIAAVDDSDESDSDVEMEAKIVRVKAAASPTPAATRKEKAAKVTKVAKATKKVSKKAEDEDEEEEEEEDGEEDEEEDDDAGEDEEVSWSDLDEEERAGLAVQRRQTINNAAALTAALVRIRVPTDKSVPFSTHQSVVPLSEPTAASIADIQDDVARELQLYRQSRDAAVAARRLLRVEGVPFSRPADYFAEMVKDDEHMQQVRARLVEAASAQKASAEARRQRDLKKFGKQVQVAKMQERAKAKKDTLEKIKTLKRKRSENGATNTHEADLFDVAVDTEIGAKRGASSAPGSLKRGRDGGRSGGPPQPNAKRQKKNEKYGFGGKKRHGKSGDAQSSGDLSGFNARRMKSGGSAFKAQRPGKARRQAAGGRR